MSSSDYLVSDYNILQKKEAINFFPKVRDIDRQYEKNNNGDNDNGVYNKFVCDSSEDNNPESSIDSESLQSSIGDSLREFANLEKYRDAQFANRVSSDISKSITIDKEAVNKMEEFGYRGDYIEKCLKENQLNHATATYYLLTNHYL